MSANKPLTLTLVGSIAAPAAALEIAQNLGYHLGRAGHKMRSGAAAGMDRAFEDGFRAAGASIELHLPFRRYNGSTSPLYHVRPEAWDMAKERCLKWDVSSQEIRRILASCCAQTLGEKLDDPSDACICWTPDGCENRETLTRATGGTSIAVLLAAEAGKPVFNLKNHESRVRLNKALVEWGVQHQVPLEVQAPAQDSLF